jgi:hypothetical protein
LTPASPVLCLLVGFATLVFGSVLSQRLQRKLMRADWFLVTFAGVCTLFFLGQSGMLWAFVGSIPLFFVAGTMDSVARVLMHDFSDCYGCSSSWITLPIAMSAYSWALSALLGLAGRRLPKRPLKPLPPRM